MFYTDLTVKEEIPVLDVGVLIYSKTMWSAVGSVFEKNILVKFIFL